MPLAKHSVASPKEGSGILIRKLRPATQADSPKPVMGDSVIVRLPGESDQRCRLPFFCSHTLLSYLCNGNEYCNQVHYKCRLEDSPEEEESDNDWVDDTYTRNRPLHFEVGQNQVISGLEIAVVCMQKGQVVEVTVPHLYAYGQRGHLPEIPPESTLIFRLELIEILPKKGRSTTAAGRKKSNT